MASTYTDIGTELMTTGENAGNWGTKTNTNIQIIEEAIRGYVAVSIAGSADTTALTYTDGSTGDSARNAVIALTGTMTGNQVVTVTAKEKVWIIDNQTSGAYTVQVLVSGQTGVTWAATDKGTKILYCNGTDVIDTGISSTGTFDLDGGELTLDADSDTSITASTDDQIDFEIAGADDFTMTANAFNVLTGSHATFADSANAKFGTGNDMLVYHDGSNSYITNATGALKLATETSGIALTIGHTTSETTIADNLTTTGDTSVGGTLGVTGVATFATHVALGDSDILKLGAGTDLTLYHDGSNSYITNAVGALKIATETSGIALTIGHTTSETTIADNLTVTGDAQGTTITATTAFVPDASDGAALGTSALEFSDLFLADEAVINFGDDQEVTLTHVQDAGLLLNSSNYLTFRDSALKISSSTDGQLDIDADTEVEITATTVDLNGILDVSGVIIAGGQISAADGSAGAPSISNTGDLDTGFLFSAANKIQYSSGGTAQVTFEDGAIVPVTDDDIDLGTASLQFKDVYVDGTLEADAITIGGSAVTAGAGAVTALNNATQSELVTVGSTTTELDAEANLTFTGSALTCIGTITTGVDNTGHDVKFFGATSGSFLLWDESDDALELTDSSPIKIGDGGDMTGYHDGSDSYVTNATGALKLATETSGIAVTIGHTTSETTVADNLTITGTTVGTTFDTNGTADAIILDANGNTTISSPTDDQIDFEIAGADDFTMTANTFTILSGSTIAIAAGGAITNAGTMAPDIVSSGKAAVFGF